MGCSNTVNSKKGRSIKTEKMKAQSSPGKDRGDSAGTHEGKSYSEENPNKRERDSNMGTLNSFKKELIFEDDESMNIPKNCVNLKLEACTTEKMFPVWVERGVKIKIIIRGKWCFIPEYGLVNYKGHEKFSIKHRDAFIGALFGRIQGGGYFQIISGMTLVSEISGPLFLSANLTRLTVQPTGSLDIYIENANFFSNDIIENMSGWNLKELDTTKSHDYLSPEEKAQIILINKIKTNPKLFGQQYLIHLCDKSESYREIYNKLIQYPKSKIIKPSKSLHLAAREHAKDIGENGTTGHKSSNGADVKTRISKYAVNPTYFGENCSYGFKDPLEIIINLLVDDGIQGRPNRTNILNENFSHVGISIQPHSCYKVACVQLFGADIVDKNNMEV
jgi:uncharacterized protein YkwD